MCRMQDKASNRSTLVQLKPIRGILSGHTKFILGPFLSHFKCEFGCWTPFGHLSFQGPFFTPGPDIMYPLVSPTGTLCTTVKNRLHCRIHCSNFIFILFLLEEAFFCVNVINFRRFWVPYFIFFALSSSFLLFKEQDCCGTNTPAEYELYEHHLLHTGPKLSL